MRKSRNIEKHSICQICKKSKKYFLRSLRSKKFDICRSQGTIIKGTSLYLLHMNELFS